MRFFMLPLFRQQLNPENTCVRVPRSASLKLLAPITSAPPTCQVRRRSALHDLIPLGLTTVCSRREILLGDKFCDPTFANTL